MLGNFSDFFSYDPICFPVSLFLFRRPNLVWGTGTAGGGLSGGSLLLDGSVAFNEGWFRHHSKPWYQVGSWDGQTDQQLQTWLWLVCGQKYVALLVHWAQVSGKSMQWVSKRDCVFYALRHQWVDVNIWNVNLAKMFFIALFYSNNTMKNLMQLVTRDHEQRN